MSKNYEVLNELVSKTQEFHRTIFDMGYGQGRQQVLDKIRAEIEEAQTYDGIYIDRAYVLQIIDEYKAESEE